jgi:hypothetical protein
MGHTLRILSEDARSNLWPGTAVLSEYVLGSAPHLLSEQ